MPLALLPAELSHRQRKPKHETNNACVGLFMEITFNANASHGRGRTEISSSEPGGLCAAPWCSQSHGGSVGPCGWEAGAGTLRESKGTKMPPKWCLCTGKGLVRDHGVRGMDAHRPCSSSRKLNKENKRTPPHLPQSPKCILQNANMQLSETSAGWLTVQSAPDKTPQGFWVPQQR